MKIPVAVLGATGLVGQHFVALLADHPWFTLEALGASERSVGKRYGDLVDWQPTKPLPERFADTTIVACSPEEITTPFVFSALDASVAGRIETAFAQSGIHVFSNAKSHRYDSAVPIFIPEVNPDHLRLLSHQEEGGKIITNSNCSVMGLALAIKPLEQVFGVKAVYVTTMQATSGAGYKGVPSLAILDNVIPFVSGEEEKIEREIPKILGTVQGDHIEPYPLSISAQCHRVPVSHGHMEAVSVALRKRASREEILGAWENFPSLSLPSAPDKPLRVFTNDTDPQPKRHRDIGEGMTASVGRLRPCSVFDYKFTVLSHNVLRGGAGGTILMAEWVVAKEVLSPNSTMWAAKPLLSGALP